MSSRPVFAIDPARFLPGAVAPETRDFNAQLARMLADQPSVIEQGVEETRAARREGRGPFGLQGRSSNAEDTVVAADGRMVRVRVFRPSTASLLGGYLHIHGGGWCLGGADMQDRMLQRIADDLAVAVVSVDYRLAPENPFPAGVDDCETAALWWLTEGHDALGTDRFVIGGDSAGAHLAALTLLRLRDKNRLNNERGGGIVAANLIYGCYDLTLTPSARQWGERRLILSTPIIQWVVDRFVPPEQYSEARRRQPDISPLYAELHDLPPALFSVGTLDPLVDDTVMMAARWAGAGNHSELAVFPGGVHGFDSFEMPLAKQSNRRQSAFIRAQLAE